jgi:hypothetical protein
VHACACGPLHDSGLIGKGHGNLGKLGRLPGVLGCASLCLDKGAVPSGQRQSGLKALKSQKLSQIGIKRQCSMLLLLLKI